MMCGLGDLPEPLIRKLFDGVFICIHCGNKDVSNTIIYDVLGIKSNQIQCNKCNTRLSYLEDRTYGLSMREIERRNRIGHWKRSPLWSINCESKRKG